MHFKNPAASGFSNRQSSIENRKFVFVCGADIPVRLPVLPFAQELPMRRSHPQLVLLFVLGLPMLLAALVFGPSAFNVFWHRHAPERYLIPSGFTGWARIDFRQPAAPPLPTEDGRRLLKLDGKGALATNASPMPGFGNNEFFYYTDSGRRPLSTAGVCKGGMVWDLETLVDERTSGPFQRFFVGTEDQYRQQLDPTGHTLPACE
jgi:hypothetical protein